MRVKKFEEQSSNQTGTSQGLKLNTNLEVPATNVDNDTNDASELGTPLLFDTDELDNSQDMLDMMMYGSAPYFPTSFFPGYGEYGQQPAYMDPDMYKEFMETMNNPLFSPDTNVADDSVNTAPDANNTVSGKPAAVNLKPSSLENYSIKVKVRHADKPAQQSRENNFPKASASTVVKEQSDATDGASTDVTEKQVQMLNKFQVKQEITEAPKLEQIVATPIPQGTILLPNGTVLIPTQSQQNSSGQTAAKLLPSSAQTPQLSLLSSIQQQQQQESLLSNSMPNVQSSISTSVQNETGNKQKFSLVAAPLQNSDQTLQVPSKSVDNYSNIFLEDATSGEMFQITNSLPTNTPERVNTIGESLEPASPTPTPNSTRHHKPTHSKSASTSASAPVEYTSTRGSAQKPGTSKRSAIKSEAYEVSNYETATDVDRPSRRKKPKLTSVDIINNIVGVPEKEDAKEKEILKEAVSKPIKHRVDVMDPTATIERSVKNAVNARVNRQKHKLYVQTLEESSEQLTAELSRVQQHNATLQQEKELLNKEVVYLKTVLANQSALSKVLSGLSGLQGVQLSSSFASRYRTSSQEGEVYTDGSAAGEKSGKTTGGVCIHVTGEQASLEMCESARECPPRWLSNCSDDGSLF